MNPILKVRDVCLSYHTLSGETPALSHISFDLMPGEFLSIVGPSGCGKSTLLNLIAGLLAPECGSITLDEKPVSAGSTAVGYMLQKDHLLEWRSIYKNILLGLEIRKELTPELLRIYGLDRFRDARPSQLSGGMRQRAALIRTLVLKPELLLLDEPFSALDYQTRLNVSDDIGKILRNSGVSQAGHNKIPAQTFLHIHDRVGNKTVDTLFHGVHGGMERRNSGDIVHNRKGAAKLACFGIYLCYAGT